MLTNLESHLYSPGQVILQRNEKVEALMLIQSGTCDLNGFIETKAGNTLKTQIVRLPESSWYGDFSILVDCESQFELEAAETVEMSGLVENYAGDAFEQDHRKDKFKKFVHIFSLKAAKLLEFGDEYPQYRRFLMLRAANRR